MLNKNYIILAFMALVLQFGLSSLASAQKQPRTDECKKPNNSELIKEGCHALDEFMKGFNKGPMAVAKTLHYPHVRFAGGKVQIWKTPKEYASDNSQKSLKESGWDHSEWIARKAVQKSDNKIHFITRFARYDKNGKIIKTSPSLYIVTKENGKWGTISRSSFVGIKGKNTAY